MSEGTFSEAAAQITSRLEFVSKIPFKIRISLYPFFFLGLRKHHSLYLRGRDTYSREGVLSTRVCLSSVKGSILKRKNLLPRGWGGGGKLFSFIIDPLFRRVFGVEENKQEVTKVISLIQNGGKSTECNQSP